MDPYELRRLDFSLGDDLEAVHDSFAGFFAKHCPTSAVRAAEPLGFDQSLWTALNLLGAASMALSAEVGGDEAGMVEMTLIAEELGRSLAPVPLLEHVVAARLLAATGDEEAKRLAGEAGSGDRILSIALTPLNGPQLVSSAAVAADVVALDGAELVVLSAGEARLHVGNQGGLPSAWCDPAKETRRIIDCFDAPALFARAQQEWKVLAAAALAGLTEGALTLALEFVKTRETMGVSIATLQGVSFPLADIAIGIAGARNLARRAAWFLDHEPATEPALPYAALAYAAKVATHGATAAAHAQGGLGFTVEADASLFFLRAKAWALIGGDPQADIQKVGDVQLSAAG
jgi:alkylation response protein AidB-like acyl-CoA dehydrogenase